MRFKAGERFLGLHTHYHTATTVDVRHNIAHDLRRHEYLEVINRLKDFRVRLFEGLRKGVTTCQTEGDFVRVNRVHLTIINNDAYVASIRTGQRSLLHTIHDTLYDSRDEACVDRTADDGVDNDQFTTPLKVNLLLVFDRDLVLLITELIGLLNRHAFLVRLDDQVNLTELTGTTGLFLMTVVGTSSFGDRLAIRNLRLVELNRHLIVVLQTPFEGTEVELTLTGNNHLAEFFRLLYHPRRILLVHTGQERCEFLCIGLCHRLDSTAVTRLRVNDRSVLVVALLCIESVSRTGIFQLHSCTNVTGCEFIYSSTDRTGNAVQLRDTLFRATLHIYQVVTVMYGTLHYAEIVHLTDMRLYRGLEDIKAGRSRSVRTDLLAIYGRIAELRRRRCHTVQEVHQTTNTHIF